MGALDQMLAQTFPTVLAPREGLLEGPQKAGVRYIVAADGLWREISLPWIHAVHKIAHAELPIPYGEMQESVEVKCTAVPKELRRRFLQDAQSAMPNEMAAALIWNSQSGEWRYELRQNKVVRPDYVSYKEVQLQEGEFIVLDLHSHGNYPAFFSDEDDRDDHGSMRFSGVVGSLSSGEITSAMRLNLNGKTWDANIAANGKLEVVSCK